MGLDAWKALAALHPTLNENATGDSSFRTAQLAHWTGEQALVIGVHHPTRQGFMRVRSQLAQVIGEELRRNGLRVSEPDDGTGGIPTL